MFDDKDSRSDKVTLYPVLKYCGTSGVGPRQESDDYLLNMEVVIQAECDTADSPAQSRFIHLGDLQFTLIRLGAALNEGFSYYDIFDSSQSLNDLGESLYEPRFEEFVEPIREKFSSAQPYEDLLYLRSFTVEPIVRGQRLGVSVLHRVIADWENGCALVALEPQPLQFAPGIQEEEQWEQLALASLSQDRQKSKAKLENHYQGLGFHTLGDLPYMLQCPQQRQMPLDEQALVHSIELTLEELEGLSDR